MRAVPAWPTARAVAGPERPAATRVEVKAGALTIMEIVGPILLAGALIYVRYLLRDDDRAVRSSRVTARTAALMAREAAP
jgi:hypothetical protein